ncbi:MAG: AMP-binding protein, partial [Bacteroidales bacterium]|nr:AMP-binding protein [Bacteroidales bacterium]
PNYEIFILGKNLELLPIGVSGELCIGGEGLARGYLCNEKLTSEKFIDHPYKSGEYLYKTGDLTRWLSNGNIEFLGRIDHQVKIRGFRIELGEIENVLLQHKSIRECAVIAREDQGDKYLCAYIVYDKEQNNEELRIYLSGLLPDYMIPSYFVELDEIPLTNNGKVNRKALPSPEIKAGGGYFAPSNLIESKLVKIWSDILNIPSKEISTRASFFELGGHSLKATVLVSRIHKELDVRIELRNIFKYQTIQGQSELIDSTESTSYFSIPKAKTKEYYPLSSSQRRLYLLQEMDLGSTAYNMPGIIEVPRDCTKEQITTVFDKLIARHENFRTGFKIENELPVQGIHKEVQLSISNHQIRSKELSKLQKEFTQAFDLSKAPLLRVGYLEVLDGQDLLMIDMHHIISDGESHRILQEEFFDLLSGKDLPELDLHYKDYSEWQNSEAQQKRIKSQESYWLEKFKEEVPVLELPTDNIRPVMQSFEGAGVSFVLSPVETQIIQNICNEQGLTMYMSLLSIFTILLSKLSGQEDIIIGSPIAARRHSDLERIVGMFLNTLALRNEVSGKKRLIDYLQDLKESTLEAYENQEYQFEDLVEQVVTNRDTSRNPLFDVMFNLLNQTDNSDDLPVFDKEENIHRPEISKFDLTMTVTDYGEQLLFNLQYSTKLFESETIERFIRCFKQIINQLPEKLEKNLSTIEIITEEEKQQLLFDFNATHGDFPKDKTLQCLFEEQVERTPDRLVLVYYDQFITYRELNSRSNQLAYLLIEKGLKTESIVGILVERSLEMILGILGVLKAGCAYLPLDKESPKERIKHIISESKVDILLSTDLATKDYEFSGEILNISDPSLYLEKEIQNINNGLPTNLAYVIYTSGSTGQPKGVMVEHKNVVNLITGLSTRIYDSYENTLHISLISPIYFDASVKQIFPSLTLGHSLHIIPEDTRFEGSDLLRYYIQHDIQIADGTPVHAQLLVQNEETNIKGLNLKQFILGGDELKKKLIQSLFDKFDNHDLKISNVYGPTECTDVTTIQTETKESLTQQGTSIGTPLPNYEIFILGKNLELLPIGVSGELCIGGEGLARGYLCNEKLT